MAFVLLAVTLAGAAGCAPGQDAGAGQQPTPETATPVAVKTLQYETITDQVSLPGNVEAWEEIEIATEVPGRIASLGVKEGDRVSATPSLDIDSLTRIDHSSLQGKDFRPLFRKAVAAALRVDHPLVRLDHDELEQLAFVAASDAALRHIVLKRVQKLHEKGAASDAELDEAVASAEADDARFRRALMVLTRSNIASPIAGIVDELPFDAGEYVSPGDVVARVVRVDRLKVVVDVPERDIPYVRVGDEPEVRFDFMGTGPLTGRVYFQRVAADMRSRTFRVEIELANPEDTIRPGMIARVTFTKRRFDKAMVVPLFAVLPFQDGYCVFVEEDGRAGRRAVELGVIQSLDVQITAGLAKGDRVIVRGQRRLQDGKRVEAREQVK